METNIRSRSQAFRGTGLVLLAGLVFASLLLPLRAMAALGGDVTSVEADQQQMKARHAVRPNDTKYTVHEITTPYGTAVREYVSPDGKVFGVAWRGPFLPDFRQLLGDSYATFAQAAQTPGTRSPDTHATRRRQWSNLTW